MAPERPGAGPGRAHAPRELPRNHQTEVGSWPLPARVVRQIQRQVALAGRSLQRLEVRGAIIDNFDALGPPSPPSPHSPHSPNYYNCGESYEEESMGEGTTSGVMGPAEDNDLTSLTWLQDRNLLRSINLSKNENDEMRPISVQISPQQSAVSGASPTSDYLEESFTSEPADSSGSDQPPASPPTPRSHTLPQRHNGYHEIPKTNGSVSKLKHPQNIAYNPLVHTQNKPPYSFSCLIFMAIEDSMAKALPVKEIYSWIVAHFPYFRSAPTGWKNSVRHNLSLNKCFQKVEKAPSLGKGSLWMVDNQYRNNLLQAFSRSPFHPCLPPSPSPEPHSDPLPAATSLPHQAPTPVLSHNHGHSQDRVPSVVESNGVKGAPNPQLFPFLSKRLAASTRRPPPDPPADTPSLDSYDSGDEVLAAAMVLALKHGPGVLSLPLPLISSCATQDHTYSFSNVANGGKVNEDKYLGSPEAGYGSDAEQRITAEVLLHLASSPPAPHAQVNQVSHRPRLLRRAPKRISPSPPPDRQPVSQSAHPPLVSHNNNNNNSLNKNTAGHSSQPRAKRPRPHII